MIDMWIFVVFFMFYVIFVLCLFGIKCLGFGWNVNRDFRIY